MYHAEKGFSAATTELLFINVDTRAGGSVAMPGDILEMLAAIMDSHCHLPVPEDVGRVMGIRKNTGKDTG